MLRNSPNSITAAIFITGVIIIPTATLVITTAITIVITMVITISIIAIIINYWWCGSLLFIIIR